MPVERRISASRRGALALEEPHHGRPIFSPRLSLCRLGWAMSFTSVLTSAPRRTCRDARAIAQRSRDGALSMAVAQRRKSLMMARSTVRGEAMNATEIEREGLDRKFC
jgi:hypothetical protein